MKRYESSDSNISGRIDDANDTTLVKVGGRLAQRYKYATCV